MGLFSSSSKKKRKQAANQYQNLQNNALSDLNTMTELGSNNSDLLQDYWNFLSNKYDTMGKDFRNYSKDNSLSDFINQKTEQNRGTLQNQFNKSFGGFGTTDSYLDNYWSMNADDQFNQNYINDYYNDALNKLDTAKSRGFLNESGYNNALKSLEDRRIAAKSQMNTLTDSILAGYRDDLASKAAGFQTAIDNYSLGDRNSLNLDSMTDAMNNLYNTQKQNFQSDLMNVVGSYKPFDVSDILAQGREKMGVISGKGDMNLQQTLADRNQQMQQNKVGLGNQGLF